MIYLYLKIHNKTGMKYLGKTICKNPEKYMGSGKLWRRHISKHGYDVKTIILLATNCPGEIKETGLFFSRIFNIVKSKDFANLMEETGDGGDTLSNNENKDAIIKKIVESNTGKTRTNETKEKISLGLNSVNRSYSGRDTKKNNTFLNRRHSEDAKKKMSESNRRFRSENSRKNKKVEKSYNKGIPKTEEHKAKLSKANLGKKPTNSRIIVIDGNEYIGMVDAAKFLGIPYSTLRNRLGSKNVYYANVYDKKDPKIILENVVYFKSELSSE